MKLFALLHYFIIKKTLSYTSSSSSDSELIHKNSPSTSKTDTLVQKLKSILKKVPKPARRLVNIDRLKSMPKKKLKKATIKQNRKRIAVLQYIRYRSVPKQSKIDPAGYLMYSNPRAREIEECIKKEKIKKTGEISSNKESEKDIQEEE